MLAGGFQLKEKNLKALDLIEKWWTKAPDFFLSSGGKRRFCRPFKSGRTLRVAPRFKARIP